MNKLTRISLQNLQALKQMYSADRVKNVVTINAITNILDRIEKTPELEERVEFLKNSPYESVKNVLDEIKVKDEITFKQHLNKELLAIIISKEDKKFTDPILPKDLEFRLLSLDNVDEINKESPREGGDDLDYVKNTILHKETIGIFVKSSNELLGWCLAMDYCCLGMGVVKSNLKRSGLGTCLILKLSKKIVTEKDIDITGNVIHGHPTSHKFIQKLGGKKFDTFTWLTARPKMLEGASRFGLFQIVY
ncbi:hypothetical protein PVAND_001371 [Polypedilum vanderplanki]|uniref:GCN5-related N-acetyltransferase Rv2170-like domain-containing protein n=1 Tax=Polypedilum vanderplanki TaxID=319348 RepID=A0A9J6BP16_POLVA|nr:hypothetical protein PVAND_001371 [Polypedilum vanderplanki]